jgi:hypothetical protein
VTKRTLAKVTKHTVTWTHPITTKPRSLELTHTRDYIHARNDHLEIRSIKPRDAPHPCPLPAISPISSPPSRSACRMTSSPGLTDMGNATEAPSAWPAHSPFPTCAVLIAILG